MIYVDDGLVLSFSQSAINKVMEYLKSAFKVPEGSANEFLGMEIERNRDAHTLKISQPGYIKKS